jgi:peptidoglycan/xylan/chitin deacetylase (PgdA/CDA1 family)
VEWGSSDDGGLRNGVPLKDNVEPEASEVTGEGSPWPDGRDFALFLSHDIDQIHDREFFHFLASVNHIRRMLVDDEKGNAMLALKRITRLLFRPKSPLEDFETILEIEARHGFRSTFFVLAGPYWMRHGPRYRLSDRCLREICMIIRKAGGEIGIHGGLDAFNNASLYAKRRRELEAQTGTEIRGIRNHLLRFSEPETWRAINQAGFLYDATYGCSERIGSRNGMVSPFHPIDTLTGQRMKLIELPLTVMDASLFRNMGLQGKKAVETAWQTIEEVIERKGMVSLLWHNNFFNEPEYADWQMAYEVLLGRLANMNPWCATGLEIAEWWTNGNG